MTSELKPCPFCGGDVKLEKTIDGREWWGVVCRNTINLGGSCAIQQLASASKEAAVERWNRRAIPAERDPQFADSDSTWSMDYGGGPAPKRDEPQADSVTPDDLEDFGDDCRPATLSEELVIEGRVSLDSK